MAKIDINSYLSEMDDELKAVDKKIEIRPIQETFTIKDYVEQLMINSETVGFSYDQIKERAEVFSNRNKHKTTEYFDITDDEYDSFCEEYCGEIKGKKFSISKWHMNRYGDLIRVFAMLDPVCKNPIVTINISRVLDENCLSDVNPSVRKLAHEIIPSRFLIVGKTGSGKTYFLNRALKEVFKDEEIKENRIALIEEFHELFPPNKNTIILNSCPVKPGEPNIFSYIIQQSNLLRLDHTFVGEIKGEEAFYFINNLRSGILGGATCHGKSWEDGLGNVKTMMALSGKCDLTQAGMIIAKAIDYVIYIENQQVKEIVKLSGVYSRENEKFQKTDLYPIDMREKNN